MRGALSWNLTATDRSPRLGGAGGERKLCLLSFNGSATELLLVMVLGEGETRSLRLGFWRVDKFDRWSAGKAGRGGGAGTIESLIVAIGNRLISD